MNHAGKPKRHVSLELDAALVEAVHSLGGDLSATVETLLARHVAQHAERARLELQIDAMIAAHNAFVAAHGLFGEEYSTL